MGRLCYGDIKKALATLVWFSLVQTFEMDTNRHQYDIIYEEPPQQPQQSDKASSEDSVYLRHCELKYVKQNDSNQYFTLQSVGMEPFHLYKNGAQEFLGKLYQSLKEAQKLVEKIDGGIKLGDGTWHETLVSENEDSKTQLRFRLNIVVTVFNGKPYLHLRNYVFLKDKQIWHPTKRGVRFAIDQKDVDTMKEFIDLKMKPKNLSSHTSQLLHPPPPPTPSTPTI